MANILMPYGKPRDPLKRLLYLLKKKPDEKLINNLHGKKSNITESTGQGGAGSVPGALTVEEEDGTPSVNIHTLKVTNAKLTDNADGTASLDVSGSGMSNPMTTTGDVIYSSDGSGTPARLGVGTDGDLMTLVSGLPAWSGSADTPKKGRKQEALSVTSADDDRYLAIRNWQSETVTTFLNQTANPQTVTVDIIPGPLETMQGTVQINVTGPQGESRSENLTIDSGAPATYETTIPSHVMVSVVTTVTSGTTLSKYKVGTGVTLGLNSYGADLDSVTKVLKNGVHVTSANYTVNTTKGTIDFSVDPTTADDYEIWMKAR